MLNERVICLIGRITYNSVSSHLTTTLKSNRTKSSNSFIMSKVAGSWNLL